MPIRRRILRPRRAPRRVRRARRKAPARPLRPTQTLVTRRVVNSADLTGWTSAVGPAGALINPNASCLLAVGTGILQQTYYATVGLQFELRDISGFAALVGLWDRYKLLAVKVRCVPVNNVSATAPAPAGLNGSAGGFIHHAVDYNDAAPPTASQSGINSLSAKRGYKMSRFTRGFSRTIRPKTLTQLYSSAVGTGYGSTAAPWVASVDTDVDHYGLKMIFEMFNPSPLTFFTNFKFECTYVLALRDPIA